MEKRRLGRTGLFVSRICLGTMTWGGKGFWRVVGDLDVDVAAAHLKRAFDAGVDFVDTANVYHEGLSEQILGEAIRRLGLPRHELVVATKVRGAVGPGRNDEGLSRVHVLRQIDESLRRLNMDHVDLYQIHGVDPLTPIDETVWALDDAVRAGKVRYVGVSNHAAWQIMKALGVSERRGFARFESVQAYYSVAGRDLEREVVPLVQDQQLGVLVWSPLAGGLLSGKFSADGGPDGSRRAQFDFPPVDRARAWPIVDAMREIAAAHDTTVARVALAWVLGQPWVTSVIIGARTDAQLQDNLAADALVLGPDERARLDALSALPPEYPGWMIERQAASRRA